MALLRQRLISLTCAREQLSENSQHVIMLQLALHMDGQAFPRALIYHSQHAEGTAVMGAVGDKVI